VSYYSAFKVDKRVGWLPILLPFLFISLYLLCLPQDDRWVDSMYISVCDTATLLQVNPLKPTVAIRVQL